MTVAIKSKKSTSRGMGQSPIDWTKRIRAANARFERMTPSERRVAIAKDVIKSLNSNQFVATNGVYCLFKQKLNTSVDLVQNIEQGPTCQVCARGALFCSAVRKFDNCETYDANTYAPDRGSFNDVERRFFSRAQIDLIEKYFEGWGNENDRSYRFCDSYVSAKDRMIVIMRNIIANNGTFKPSQLPMGR